MTAAIVSQVILECRVCGRHVPHKNDGIQVFPNSRLQLWTSVCCQATRAEAVRS
jgi:hypothetical protein